MPNIPRLPRAIVPGLPGEALDALLAGHLAPDEAGAGLQPVAGLLAALAAAPEGGELAGHARALAEFRHRPGRPARSHRSARRRSRLLPSLLSARAAAAAAAATALGGLATAAYAGVLPAPAQQLAHNTIGAPSPHPGNGPQGQQPTPSGPAVPGPAAFGLCTAYAHARADGTATQRAVAFRKLAAAAGGAGKVAAYCAAVPHPGSPQSGQPAPHRPGRPSSAPAAHATGQPSSHPSGKPSSVRTPHATGKPSSHPSGKPPAAGVAG
jgi:hypothetical protein